MKKGWKIVIIVCILATLAGAGWLVFGNKKTDTQQQYQPKFGVDYMPLPPQAANPANTQDTPPQAAQPTPAQTGTVNETQAQLQALIPAKIADSVNAFTDDQWTQIVTKVNTFSPAQFQDLSNQLAGISTIQSWAINALSTDVLFNAAMKRLNNI